MDDFAKRLDELRKEKGITQKELAKSINVTTQAISSYCSGRTKPSYDVAAQIAQFFNVSLDWLCGISDVKQIAKDGELTYKDFLLFLIKYDEKYGIDKIEGGSHISEAAELEYGWPKSVAKASILIENIPLSVFFDKWVKVRQQYLDGIIDADIYDLWLQRELGQSWTLEKIPKSNIKNKYELPF